MLERLQRAVGLKWVHILLYWVWYLTSHINNFAILKHHLPFLICTQHKHQKRRAISTNRHDRWEYNRRGSVSEFFVQRVDCGYTILYFVLATKTSFSLQKKGILSGKYIFEEPLQHYWAEKRAEELASMKGEVQQISTTSGVSNAQIPKSKWSTYVIWILMAQSQTRAYQTIPYYICDNVVEYLITVTKGQSVKFD